MHYYNLSKRLKKCLAVGVIFILCAFTIFFYLNIPTLHSKTISFKSRYGQNEVTLQATYTECKNARYAVLICPGYSCDRQKWRPISNMLASRGLAVMSFDYAGQGASSDTLGFDNAKTDNIPSEISDAIEVLHDASGIDYDHIILLGHSMGGRSILRLLFDYNNSAAQTSVTKRNIENVILFSPEVNYNFNAQASLFAGTSDDAEEPWHSYNADYTLGTNVYLYGSTSDDIVSDEDILDIFLHLGAANVPESGIFSNTQTNRAGSQITVGITSGVLHSYEMYSPRFCTFLNEALNDIMSSDGVSYDNYPPVNFVLIYIAWFLSLAGLALTLYALNKSVSDQTAESDSVPILLDEKAFLKIKLLMWLPAVLVAFLICCLCVCIPFGSPVMNLPYMCFISGYGIVMLLSYRKGKLKGTSGTLPKAFTGFRPSKKAVLPGLISFILCLFVWYVMHSSMYRLIPANARLFWVLFATVLMTVGFYVSGCESDMLERANASSRTVILYNLIQYIALFLLIAFYLIIKSYSGMIGQAQNMLLLYVFCAPLGSYIRKCSHSRLLGATLSAFVFQTLMITSAALIAIL